MFLLHKFKINHIIKGNFARMINFLFYNLKYFLHLQSDLEVVHPRQSAMPIYHDKLGLLPKILGFNALHILMKLNSRQL